MQGIVLENGDDNVHLSSEIDVPKGTDIVNENSSKDVNLYDLKSKSATRDLNSSLISPKKVTSWDDEIQPCDITSLNELIESLGLSSEELTQKDAQRRTICHALVSLPGDHSSAKYLPRLLSDDGLRGCMTCQDLFGNTPLHCIVEAQNDNIIESVLRHAPAIAEGLTITNRDNLTPLELAFEKKLWVPARVLAEHQIKTGASPVFLQDYFFKAMREQGGVDFLPHLLDLWKCYCPHLDLNFGVDTTGRTPWWYLVNSNDVSVMCRVVQALRNHSVDLTSLRTHTNTETTLLEEAVETNRILFMTSQKVAGWCQSDIDKDTANQNQDMKTALGSSRALSRVSSCSSITDSTYSESESSILEHLLHHCLINQAEDDPSVLSTSDDNSYSET